MKINEDTELRKNNARGRRRMRREQYFIGQVLKNNNRENCAIFHAEAKRQGACNRLLNLKIR